MLPRMLEALGSIYSTTKETEGDLREKEGGGGERPQGEGGQGRENREGKRGKRAEILYSYIIYSWPCCIHAAVIFHITQHSSCIIKPFMFCLPSNSHISELASKLCVSLFGNPNFVQPTELEFKVT